MTIDNDRLTFGGLLRTPRIVLCCGPGGVGKTTTAAAIGLGIAMSGRRCAVVTIDPAKRLANALGLEGLTNQPARIALGDHPASASGGEPADLQILGLGSCRLEGDGVRKGETGAFGQVPLGGIRCGGDLLEDGVHHELVDARHTNYPAERF